MKSLNKKTMKTIETLKGKRVIAKDPQGNLSVGEYTGFEKITGKHYVAFYNGYVGKFDNIKDINFTN